MYLLLALQQAPDIGFASSIGYAFAVQFLLFKLFMLLSILSHHSMQGFITIGQVAEQFEIARNKTKQEIIEGVLA